VTPVAFLRSLTPRDYVTLMIVTGMLTFALGFAGAAVLIVYGPQQGTAVTGAGTVTDALHLTRGDP